jgi:hypothetical protein
MKSISRTAFAAALLLTATPAFAEGAHHPATTEAPAAPVPDTGSTMIEEGMMDGDMMQMMKEMMGRHAGMMRGMMSVDGMADGGSMRQMMSPERVEGRIAFLRTELKVTETQEPLWEAVAEALRANAESSKGTMSGIVESDGSKTLPQRLADRGSMLSARLDDLRRLKTAIEPFYASLDETQKATVDELLMPMSGM